MTTQRQIDANRKNSAKSTGPKTLEGLERSSMNAMVHGLRSQKVARAREDSYAFESRRHKWLAIADACDDREEFLVNLTVCQAFCIEHAQRAQVERVSSLIENYDQNELDEVHRLGKRLFFDAAGPTPLYGIEPYFQAKKKKTSWNGEAVDSNDPALLVRALEKSRLGCIWLRFRWLDLKARAETGIWLGLDRLKSIRLLGMQPIAALEDERVARIFVASDAIRHTIGGVFADLGGEMISDQLGTYENELFTRWPDLLDVKHEAEGREALIELVSGEIEHLDELLKAHAENADAVAENTLNRLRHDDTPEGTRNRAYALKCTSAYYRGMEACKKYKKGIDQGRVTREEDTARRVAEERRATGLTWQTAGAVRLPKSDASTHQPCTELQTPDANKANFCESMITGQNVERVEVTASFGPDLGLDNVAGQPREDVEREGGETREAGALNDQIGGTETERGKEADGGREAGDEASAAGKGEERVGAEAQQGRGGEGGRGCGQGVDRGQPGVVAGRAGDPFAGASALAVRGPDSCCAPDRGVDDGFVTL
jgi:hypothetical protein